MCGPHYIARFISLDTSTSRTLALCNTIFQIALYRSHYATATSRTPFHITFHIMPHALYSTPHFRSRILATLCIVPPHLASHHILHHIALHFTCRSTSCIIPSPHLTMITPNCTSHYHVSHNVPHHTSVHHHILCPTTYHI